MEQQDLISSGVADIASSLGISESKTPPPDDGGREDGGEDHDGLDEGDSTDHDGVNEGDAADPADAAAADAKAAADVAEVAPPPRSWAKDTHELWKGIPPEAQKQILHREEQMLAGIEQYREFHGVGKQMKEVITPYIPMIQSAGLDPAKAVGVLLQANYRLTNGPVENRRQAFLELGTSLGLIQQQGGQGGATAAVPPELMDRLNRMEYQMTQAQRETYESRRAEVTKQVGEFWEKHPLADEVADDMAIYIKAGVPIETAYEKAVYANPATREKELARLQTETKAKADAKAREEVAAARKSTAGNVRGRDTNRSPTEPKGKFLDEGSMTEDLRAIKARTH